MNLIDDYIGLYENMLSDDTCNELISNYENSKQLNQTCADFVDDGNIRKGHEVFLDDEDLSILIQHKTFLVIRKYEKEHKKEMKFLSEHTGKNGYRLEKFRLRKYEKNSGFFKDHIDIANYKTASRLFVIMFYLNNVSEGGETEFLNIDKKVKPKKGSCVIFHPNFMFPHVANIPISDDKYTCQTYLHWRY